VNIRGRENRRRGREDTGRGDEYKRKRGGEYKEKKRILRGRDEDRFESRRK
jgi:hypothetical protein